MALFRSKATSGLVGVVAGDPELGQAAQRRVGLALGEGGVGRCRKQAAACAAAKYNTRLFRTYQRR